MADSGKGNSRFRQSRFRMIFDFVKRLVGRKPAQPEDPYAYVTAPLRRGPKGRSGAAVAEVDDDNFHSFPPRNR